MPRPDGTLYNFEKKKLAPPSRPVGRPPKPVELHVLPDPKPAKEPHPCSEQAWAKAKGGRPVTRKTLTREECERVIDEIRHGMTIESALVLVGIGRAVFDKWRAANPLLQLEFEKAEAEFESRLVRKVDSFANTSERSAHWLLERRRPASWSSVSKQEITGKNGAALGELTVARNILANVTAGDPADAAKPIEAAKAKTA